MKKTEISILIELRKNGRIPLTTLSKKLKLAISTLHDKLKNFFETNTAKPCVLLDFEKIGYNARANILFAAEDKEKLTAYLKEHPNVNSISRINNGWNIMTECIFKDMYAMEEFIENIEKKHRIKQKQVHYIINDIKREGFLPEEPANI